MILKKFYYDRPNDVIRNTSKETGLSEDKIKFIINNFWKSVRSYLTSPLTCYKGILLNGFGKFYLNKKGVNNIADYYVRHKINSVKLEYYSKLKEKVNED